MKDAPNCRRGTGASGLPALARVLLTHFTLLSLPASAAAVTDSPSATPADAVENLTHLETLVRDESVLQFAPLTERQRLVVGPIDPHLEVAKCSHPLQPVTPAHHMQDRVMIEVRCADAKPWHVYVPVRIIGTSPVAVAVHAIVSGSVLKASDLRVEQHDISDLPLGFIDDPAVAVGFTASRPISGGAYLTNQQLVAAKAVQRGQSVTLIADADGVTIRMAGRAMSDGLLNQRIKVQNLSSGKIIEGITRSEQIVEIILQ